MTLIVVCGQPCSGKTTITAQLKALLTSLGLAVSVVDEPSLGLDRNSAYQDLISEKNCRGMIRSAVERALMDKSVLVLDSLNNIKGYRYELWCIARAAGTRYCLVHVDTDAEQCRSWNSQREGATYRTEIFEDLAGRFERPDTRNRWDSPLFEVRPARDATEDVAAVLQRVAAAIASPSSTSSSASAASSVAPDYAGQRARELQPSHATTSQKLAGTNVLHEIDRAAQDMIECIDAASTQAAGGAPGLVQFGDDVPSLKITQPVTLAELRRLKRDFIRLATKNTFTRLQDSASARRMFVEFLDNNMHS